MSQSSPSCQETVVVLILTYCFFRTCSMSYPIVTLRFFGAAASACAGVEKDEGSGGATVQLAFSILLSRRSKWIRLLVHRSLQDGPLVTHSPVLDCNRKSCGSFQRLKQRAAFVLAEVLIAPRQVFQLFSEGEVPLCHSLRSFELAIGTFGCAALLRTQICSGDRKYRSCSLRSLRQYLTPLASVRGEIILKQFPLLMFLRECGLHHFF